MIVGSLSLFLLLPYLELHGATKFVGNKYQGTFVNIKLSLKVVNLEIYLLFWKGGSK